MNYFAYGSNMIASQMAARCPDAKLLGVAALPGHKFRINIGGYGTVVRERGCRVYGLLWDISEADGLALDLYEDVAGGLYGKTFLTVSCEDGRSAEALIYLATDPAIGSPRPAYMASVVAAAESLDLPVGYVQELRSWLPAS